MLGETLKNKTWTPPQLEILEELWHSQLSPIPKSPKSLQSQVHSAARGTCTLARRSLSLWQWHRCYSASLPAPGSGQRMKRSCTFQSFHLFLKEHPKVLLGKSVDNHGKTHLPALQKPYCTLHSADKIDWPCPTSLRTCHGLAISGSLQIGSGRPQWPLDIVHDLKTIWKHSQRWAENLFDAQSQEKIFDFHQIHKKIDQPGEGFRTI